VLATALLASIDEVANIEIAIRSGKFAFTVRVTSLESALVGPAILKFHLTLAFSLSFFAVISLVSHFSTCAGVLAISIRKAPNEVSLLHAAIREDHLS